MVHRVLMRNPLARLIGALALVAAAAVGSYFLFFHDGGVFKGSDEEQVTELYNGFADDMNSGNLDALVSRTCGGADFLNQLKADGSDSGDLGLDELVRQGKLTVTNIKVHGDAATADTAIEADGRVDKGQLPARHENGKWCIPLFDTATGG